MIRLNRKLARPIHSTFLLIIAVCFIFDVALFTSDSAAIVINPTPIFSKLFVPDTTGPGTVSTLSFTIDNTASATAATGLDFTDNLPAGLLVALPPNASTTCTGGTVTAVAGSSTITYTGGTVAAAASCTVSVDVVSSTTGFFVNTTGDLTSSEGNSGTATDTLAVDPAPGFSKAFVPNPILTNGVSTLTFTIDNSLSTSGATALDFTDNLPAAVIIATPSNASTDCTGGTLTADDGTGVITYTGGSVAAGASCTVQVDVSSSTAGSHVNTSGALTSSLGSSGTANDTLRVNPPPGFSKAFSPDPILTGGTSTLTFTIDNSGSTTDATILNFNDNLPAGVIVATPSNISSGCTGGLVTAAAGSSSINYTGGTITAGSSCTIQVDVVGTTSGLFNNTTTTLTSSLGVSAPATDTLTVNNQADLSITKTDATDPVAPGDNLTYTITVTNNGPQTADSVVVTDTLPANVVLVATSGCAEDPFGVPACTLGSIASGSSAQYTIDVTVDARASGTITNQADVTSDATDPVPGNNNVTEDTSVASPTPGRYLLSVFKSGDGSGTVTSSNIPGINCGPDCGQYANPRSTISLNAVPNEGSVFEGWSGVCTGTGGCTVVMNGNRNVTAAFSKADSDGDGTPDDSDLCPDDPDKIEPGACGCGMADDDNDNNGIPDCLDTDDSDIPEDLDMDGDGIPDRDQDDLWVVAGGTDGDLFVGIAAPPGVDLALLEWIDPSTIDDTVNRPDQLPLGLISFSGMTANPGDTVELVIYFSEPIPEDAVWYKYDPVNGWYDFSDYVVISDDRMSLTILIQDGGPGDADGEVNGVFDDPSGPGLFNADDNGLDDDTTPVTPGSSSGSGGGCFLKAAERE